MAFTTFEKANKIRQDLKQAAKNKTEKNPVLFVGAGPGDPELITVKGQKALQNADLVVYAGSLVPEALLTWAKKGSSILPI